jgi:hypothetical protein
LQYGLELQNDFFNSRVHVLVGIGADPNFRLASQRLLQHRFMSGVLPQTPSTWFTLSPGCGALLVISKRAYLEPWRLMEGHVFIACLCAVTPPSGAFGLREWLLVPHGFWHILSLSFCQVLI